MPGPDSLPPLWLLDVDGVVNAVSPALPETWPPDRWVRREVPAPVEGHGLVPLPIIAAQPVLDFLTLVHSTGAAEICWHSTWRTSAVSELAPALGLPPFAISVAPEWTESPRQGWWKLPAAERAAQGNRLVLWTDDDIAGYLRSEPEIAKRLTTLALRKGTMLVSPERHTGLSPADLARIGSFLNLPR